MFVTSSPPINPGISPPAAQAVYSSMANNKPKGNSNTQYRSDSPPMPAWILGPTMDCQSSHNLNLPKYFRGTIEKVEFDLGPAKTSARDLQRMYLERFARAVHN